MARVGQGLAVPWDPSWTLSSKKDVSAKIADMEYADHFTEKSLSPRPSYSDASRDPMQKTLKEFSTVCSSLANANWGVVLGCRARIGEFPIKLCDRAVDLLQTIQGCRSSETAALDTLQEMFGSTDSMVRRILRVVENDVDQLCQHQGAMLNLMHALNLLVSVLNIAPQGFTIKHASVLSEKLLTLMLSGLETQYKVGSERVKLRPLRDALMQGPLLATLPAVLASLIESRIQPALGEWGTGLPDLPDTEWCYAAGNFAKELLEIMDDAPSSKKISSHPEQKLNELMTKLAEIVEGNVAVHAAQPSSSKHCKRDTVPKHCAEKPSQSRPTRGRPRRASTAGASAKVSIKLAEATSTKLEERPASCDLNKNSDMQVILDIVIEILGGATLMIEKLMEFLERQVRNLCPTGADVDACLPSAGNPAMAATAKTIRVICDLVKLAIHRDGIVPDHIAQQIAPVLIRCLMRSELKEARISMSPLFFLAVDDMLLFHTTGFLWQMVTEALIHATVKADEVDLWVAGCFAVELEERLMQPGMGDVQRHLNAVRAVQWLCQSHLEGQAMDTIAAPLKIMHEAPAPAKVPSKAPCTRRKIDADLSKASSSSAVPCSSELALAESSEGSDWCDESEDINSGSSETEGSDDNGSDLEDFVDVSKEANPYGLVEKCLLSSSTSRPSSSAIQAFLDSELIENYQDHLPAPSSSCMEDDDGDSADPKRRRLSPFF